MMDCRFDIQDMVPFVALEKLKTTIDISAATPEEMLRVFSELVWIFEEAYHNVEEREGFKWTNYRD